MMIFNADDLGMSEEIDKEIFSAAQLGIIQSASASVVNGINRKRFNRLVEMLPNLQIGLHLNLTEGFPASKNFPKQFQNGDIFKSAFEMLLVEKSLSEDFLYQEMKAQFDTFVKLAGSKPNHLDIHQHYGYISPKAFKTFLTLAAEERIEIRSPRPFLSENRLQEFANSVKLRYGISVPFETQQRCANLREIFEKLGARLRTQDCLVNVPEQFDINKYKTKNDLEIVCHPHVRGDFEKLTEIYRFKV